MGTIASQITSLTIVYSTVYSDADQRKYQSSASLAFVRGIHWRPVNSPHKWPATRKMFPFDDVIMGILGNHNVNTMKQSRTKLFGHIIAFTIVPYVYFIIHSVVFHYRVRIDIIKKMNQKMTLHHVWSPTPMKECYVRSNYQGQGQVITSYGICVM